MSTTEIRAEIVELINAGMMNVPKIVSYFKNHRETAPIEIVKREAKELVALANQWGISRRGIR